MQTEINHAGCHATIEHIQQENKLCLFMGDFNIDLLKIDSHADSELFLNSLGTCFQPHILQPTRITDHSASLIDNIFFNSIEHITISGNVVYDLPDHLPNFVILNRFSDVSFNTKLYRRDYSNFNQSVFLDDVRSVDWESILEYDSDPSRMFDSIYQALRQIVDRHIPTRQLSKSEQKFYSKPWIIPAPKTSIRVKNALYRKYRKTKSVYVHCKFKCYRNRGFVTY